MSERPPRPKALGTCDAAAKAKYSRRDAETTARLIRRRNHDRVQAYPCSACGRWHVGHAGRLRG